VNTLPPPARLFVILAREAPVGVIFRRGPYPWTQLIHWDTSQDQFTLGQWFKGRVYERRSDLSSNGQLLIYSASKYFVKKSNFGLGTYAGHMWSAISKPPYLTALAFWEHNVYYGGGAFETDRKALLNTEYSILPLQTQFPADFVIDDYPQPDVTPTDPDPYMYRYRLKRDGWELVDASYFEARTHYFLHAKLLKSLWRKTNGDLTIEQTVGQDWRFNNDDKYTLINGLNGKTLTLENVMWADFDQRKRLMLAKEGKIFSATMNDSDVLNLQELADFNGQKPDPLPSPEWARTW
jgi:hypothetical protein